MPHIELQMLLGAEEAEAWSEALLEEGAISVSIEDEDRDTGQEVAAYGEPGLPAGPAAWPNNRVSVLLEFPCDAAGRIESIARARGWRVPPIALQRVLEDRDWVQLSQAQFAPVNVGRLWIVPSWHVPPDPAAINVRIDPGTAFGTGTHPTTRLCLRWLDALLEAGSRVLDYGCGSGILSIGAALLGAGRVEGVDIDPASVAAAQANAQRNGVSARYTTPDLLDEGPTNTGPMRRFDLVVANILANPLVLLAPALVARIDHDGSLLLSGILERQATGVIEAYRCVDERLRLSVWAAEDGWVALAGRRED